jgi:hypothetical protein
MRKSFIGLMVVTLLLFAGQARAQGNGTADPLGLIASGAIQPFWGLGANITVFEVASPVQDNSFFDLEGIFFNANCVRVFSFPLPITQNGIAVFSTAEFGVNFQGLLVLGRQGPDNITLFPIPIFAPIHVKGQWINLAADHVRPVDPIGVVASENPVQTYNVLRSAASFVSPLEGATFHTEIYLNCPSPAILTATFAPALGFPVAPATAFSLSAPTVQGVVFNGDEEPLLDFELPCSCSSMFPVLSINPVYGDPSVGSLFLYTELVTYSFSVPANPPTFTGYRSVVITDPVWPGGTGDDFGRLNNGSAAVYLNLVPPVVRGLR